MSETSVNIHDVSEKNLQIEINQICEKIKEINNSFSINFVSKIHEIVETFEKKYCGKVPNHIIDIDNIFEEVFCSFPVLFEHTVLIHLTIKQCDVIDAYIADKPHIYDAHIYKTYYTRSGGHKLCINVNLKNLSYPESEWYKCEFWRRLESELIRMVYDFYSYLSRYEHFTF